MQITFHKKGENRYCTPFTFFVGLGWFPIACLLVNPLPWVGFLLIVTGMGYCLISDEVEHTMYNTRIFGREQHVHVTPATPWNMGFVLGAFGTIILWLSWVLIKSQFMS